METSFRHGKLVDKVQMLNQYQTTEDIMHTMIVILQIQLAKKRLRKSTVCNCELGEEIACAKAIAKGGFTGGGEALRREGIYYGTSARLSYRESTPIIIILREGCP